MLRGAKPWLGRWLYCLGVLGVFAALPLPLAGAQTGGFTGGEPAEPDVRVSAVVLPTTGEIYRGDITAVATGLRRGLRDVDGIDFVYAEELLSRQTVPEEVYAAQDSVDAIEANIATESPRDLLAQIEEIWAIFEQNLASVSRSTLVRVLTMRGVAECRLRARGCGEAFREVLAFRESALYDTEVYPPEFLDAFEDARLDVLGRPRGAILISTNPPGAEVFVDGRSYGPSPAQVGELIQGTHYVTARTFGFEEVVRAAEVEAAATEVYIELEESAGALLFTQDEGAIDAELGRPQAGRAIQGMDAYLPVAQVVIARLVDAGGQIRMSLYLYDLRTQFLLAERDAQISANEGASEVASRLARELYEGVDLSGEVQAPEQGPEFEEEGEVWEKWWFWTAIGVVAVSGVTAAVVLPGALEPEIPSGVRRFGGSIE